MKPLAIDICCGLGGWTDGLLAEGWDVIGFDIEQHIYGDKRYPAQLVIQDVLTLHGSQFRNVDLIVASPPCQEFSYMAMPWSRAKQIRRALLCEDTFPDGYTGSRTIAELTALFDACFRIQREACEASGRFIPMVVENVRGAQEWVGRSRWNAGSFFLWGDTPALMPVFKKFKSKGMNWSDQSIKGQDFTRVAGQQAMDRESSGQKLPGNNAPRLWSQRRAQRLADGLRYDEDSFYCSSSGSVARKAASAVIAKIPEPLSRWIARTYYPTAIKCA